MEHRRAVALMVLVTLMWSIAGVVTRHLESAASFEVTFWRSAFNALALAAGLSWMRGASLWTELRHAQWPMWVSALFWSIMYTAFMVAITLTTVANVLITMSVAPFMTALFARGLLAHRIAARTWLAIAAAGAGIAWMFASDAGAAQPGAWVGTLVAFCVPLAAAANWTLLQHVAQRGRSTDSSPDMLPAVLIGALISAVVTLPLAWPLQASAHDVVLLSLLGVVQLAIPCLLAVRLTRVLPGPEIALLSLLEVVFGVAWAWLGAGERPSSAALQGGAVVLGALLINEAYALRARRWS